MSRSPIIVCAFLIGSQLFGQIAEIAGTTVDASTGDSLSGVVVTAIRGGLPPFSTHATSIAGIFVLAGLPAGTYTICAKYQGDGYLDPCEWDEIPQTVTVTADKIVTGQTIRLTKGSVVQVQMQDSQGLLTAKTAAGRPTDISIGVWGGKGGFHPAHLSGGFASLTNYQLTIPFDKFVAIDIRSASLSLADSKGNNLTGNSFQQRFQQKSTSPSAQSFSFQIKGLVP